MLKILWKAIGLVPIVFSAVSLLTSNVYADEVPIVETAPEPMSTAAEQANFTSELIEQNIEEIHPLSEVTSVGELSDIQPTDWAFQALHLLVDRYNCLAAYPDDTYRGNRELSRYEFAVSLSACFNNLRDTTPIEDLATQEELATVQRLLEEFATELEAVEGQIDNLEQLEINQFSTTTKLDGDVTFALSAAGGGEKADGSGDEIDRNLTLSQRVSLDFETSFTGRDRLSIGLSAKNFDGLGDATGTKMARLAVEEKDENDGELNEFKYRFPIGKQVRVYLSAVGGSLSNLTDSLDPSIGDAISLFGKRNPIYKQSGGSGVGLVYKLSDAITVSLAYVPDDGDEIDAGIVDAPYAAIAQLSFTPSDRIGLGLTYVHSYNSLDTGRGSERSDDPFDDESEDITANSFGTQLNVRVSPTFAFGGWLGFTQASAGDLAGHPTAKILNYAFTLAFSDLGKEGSIATIIIGQPPKLIDNDFEVRGRRYEDEDTALHLEASYTFRATENIDITSGILVIINPEHNSSNDTIYVGTIQTHLSF